MSRSLKDANLSGTLERSLVTFFQVSSRCLRPSFFMGRRAFFCSISSPARSHSTCWREISSTSDGAFGHWDFRSSSSFWSPIQNRPDHSGQTHYLFPEVRSSAGQEDPISPGSHMSPHSCLITWSSFRSVSGWKPQGYKSLSPGSGSLVQSNLFRHMFKSVV